VPRQRPVGHEHAQLPRLPAQGLRLALREDWVVANPCKAAAAELGVAESTAIYLYGLDLDETGPADPLSLVEPVLYLMAAMTGMRQGELLFQTSSY